MEDERVKRDKSLVVYQIPLGTQPMEISNYFRSIFPHLSELKMHISIPKKGKLVQNEIVKTAMAFLVVGSNEERDEIIAWYEQQKIYRVKFTNSHNITTSIHISYNYGKDEDAASYKKHDNYKSHYQNHNSNTASATYNTSFNSQHQQYQESRNKMNPYNFSEANRNTATQHYPSQTQMYQSPSSDTQLYTPPLPLYAPPLPPFTPPTSNHGDDSSVHSATSSRFNDLTEILKTNGFNHENAQLIQSMSTEKLIWSEEKLSLLDELTRMEDRLKRKSDLFVSELEVIELKSQEDNYKKELVKYGKLLVEAKLELNEVKSDFEKLNQ